MQVKEVGDAKLDFLVYTLLPWQPPLPVAPSTFVLKPSVHLRAEPHV